MDVTGFHLHLRWSGTGMPRTHCYIPPDHKLDRTGFGARRHAVGMHPRNCDAVLGKGAERVLRVEAEENFSLRASFDLQPATGTGLRLQATFTAVHAVEQWNKVGVAAPADSPAPEEVAEDSFLPISHHEILQPELRCQSVSQLRLKRIKHVDKPRTFRARSAAEMFSLVAFEKAFRPWLCFDAIRYSNPVPHEPNIPRPEQKTVGHEQTDRTLGIFRKQSPSGSRGTEHDVVRNPAHRAEFVQQALPRRRVRRRRVLVHIVGGYGHGIPMVGRLDAWWNGY